MYLFNNVYGVNMEKENDIVSGALLIEMNLRNFGLSRKLDQGEVSAIADKHGNKELFTGGSSPTTRANKFIIPKELYDPIASFQRETRKIHNEYTLGMRWTTNQDIMSTKMYSGGSNFHVPYAEFVEDRKAKLDLLAHKFAYTTYPQAIIVAKNDLGNLYNDDDYMSKDEVYKSIGMTVNITPISKGSDFRCSLDPQVKEKVQEAHDERLREVQKESVLKLISGLSSKVQHIKDSLDQDKVLHDKTLEDLYKHAVDLPAIDFTNDDRLSELADEIASGLMNQGFLKKEHLKDQSVRERTKNQAEDLARKLDAYADVKEQEGI